MLTIERVKKNKTRVQRLNEKKRFHIAAYLVVTIGCLATAFMLSIC